MTDKDDQSHDDPRVEITSGNDPAPPRDAGAIDPAEFEFRALGVIEGARDAKFQAVFTSAALREIHDHGKSSMEAEICGVLVGNVYRDSHGPYVRIHACIRGDSADSRNAQVTFKADTWTHIQQAMERDHPDARIVGWYHTHPGFGIFLSGMDLFIQDHFFNLPWQVALVYDPHAEEEGVFIWRSNKSEAEPFLVEPAMQSTETTGSTVAFLDSIAGGTEPTTVAQTSDRKTWIAAGILFAASFGLTYALMTVLRSS